MQSPETTRGFSRYMLLLPVTHSLFNTRTHMTLTQSRLCSLHTDVWRDMFPSFQFQAVIVLRQAVVVLRPPPQHQESRLWQAAQYMHMCMCMSCYVVSNIVHSSGEYKSNDLLTLYILEWRQGG